MTDRGIGIPAGRPAAAVQRAFTRGTNVGNIQGTGISLHIVKGVRGLHCGTIDVQSRPGQGTSFHASARTNCLVSPMACIPIVDDDPALLRLLSLRLRHEGHRVIEADSGEAGWPGWTMNCRRC